MSDRNKLIVGLADSPVGKKVANVIANVTANDSALTVGAAGGSLGFFGTSPAPQATAAEVTDFASLKTALQAYGLVGS